MIGDGELSDRDVHHADPDLTWAWDQVSHWGDLEIAAPRSPDSAPPESIWGEETAGMGAADLELPADPDFHSIWPFAPEGDDQVVDQSLVADQPRGKPTLVPAPVPHRRRSGLRQALGALQRAPRVATLALVVIISAGVLLAFAAVAQDPPAHNASHPIDAAGLQSTSTMPTSTVPRAPSTSLTTLVTPPKPDPTGGEAPAATSAPPLPAAPRATTPVTTAAPRSPARAEATVAPVASPEQPAPAPTPPEIEAPPPPSSIVLLPTEPETTVTTRRPRATVPNTVAPSTTVPASNDVPGEEDLTVPE